MLPADIVTSAIAGGTGTANIAQQHSTASVVRDASCLTNASVATASEMHHWPLLDCTAFAVSLLHVECCYGTGFCHTYSLHPSKHFCLFSDPLKKPEPWKLLGNAMSNSSLWLTEQMGNEEELERGPLVTSSIISLRLQVVAAAAFVINK